MFGQRATLWTVMSSSSNGTLQCHRIDRSLFASYTDLYLKLIGPQMSGSFYKNSTTLVSEMILATKLSMSSNTLPLANLFLPWCQSALVFIWFNSYFALTVSALYRWDPAFVPPFSTVTELMDVAKSCLDVGLNTVWCKSWTETNSLISQALDFLHSHRIAHQDFSLGNVGMNLYRNSNYLRVATGVREPKDVRYTIYDFGYSLIYPMDTDIDTVNTSRRLSYYHAPDPSGPYNPFKSDVAMMGGLLHGHVMVCSLTRGIPFCRTLNIYVARFEGRS